MQESVEIEEPQSEMEKKLATIWAGLLKVDIEKIGRQTSFFELGGDSISAIQLVSMCASIGLHVDTKTVFKKPTLAMMAAVDGKLQVRALKDITVE